LALNELLAGYRTGGGHSRNGLVHLFERTTIDSWCGRRPVALPVLLGWVGKKGGNEKEALANENVLANKTRDCYFTGCV